MNHQIKSFVKDMGLYLVMVMTLIIFYFAVILIAMSQWGDHRYLVGGFGSHDNSIFDKKNNFYLEFEGDSIEINDRYIYSVKQKTLLKIDYCNDRYFLYNAPENRVNEMRKYYNNNFQVLIFLNHSDQKIYQNLLENKKRYPVESLGHRMWDKFSF